MIIRENKIIDQFPTPKHQQIWLPFWKLLVFKVIITARWLWRDEAKLLANHSALFSMIINAIILKAYSRGHRCVLNNLFHECALDMRWYIANEARITISYETSAIEIIVLFKKPMKYREFFPTLFVKITNFSLFLNLSRRVHLPYFIWRAW